MNRWIIVTVRWALLDLLKIIYYPCAKKQGVKKMGKVKSIEEIKEYVYGYEKSNKSIPSYSKWAWLGSGLALTVYYNIFIQCVWIKYI